MTRTGVVLSVAVFVAVLSALPATAAPSARIGAAEGKIVMGGSAPFTFLALSGGAERLTLAGPLVEELRRLQGVSVRVVGWLGPSPQPGFSGAINVAAYAPAADGFGKAPKALVGLLVKQSEAWLIVDLGSARIFELVGSLPLELTEAEGAKVVVSGKAAKGRVTPRGFIAASLKVLAPAGKYPLEQRWAFQASDNLGEVVP